MTLQRFIDTLWPMYLDNRQAQPSTRASYQSMLANFILPNFGAQKLDEITPKRLSEFTAAVAKKYSGKYAMNIFSLLKVIFDVAVAHDLLQVSPLRQKLHRPLNVRSAEKESYSVDQIKKIIEHTPEEYRLLTLVAAIMSAPRAGELLAFRWCDLQDGVLKIEHSLWRGELGSPKTRASKRSIPVPPELLFLLEEKRRHAEWSGDADFIFCRPDGKPCDPDHLRECVLYPALKAAGIQIKPRQNGFHAFRQSAGSLLYAMTKDLEMVKGFLRHTRIATTSDIYLHTDEKLKAEAPQVLAGMLIKPAAEQVVGMSLGA